MLLTHPNGRIEYLERKLRRFGEEFRAWRPAGVADEASRAWEELVRDACRLGRDVARLDRDVADSYVRGEWDDGYAAARRAAELFRPWYRLCRRVAAAAARAGRAVGGLDELRAHRRRARRLAASAPLSRIFRALVAVWREETLFLSSSSAIVAHPAFRRIVGMGLDAVPLLLDRVAKDPDHLVIALRMITGEDPVRDADRGNFARMAEAWVRWGHSHTAS